MDCMLYLSNQAKTKALVNCAVAAQLICACFHMCEMQIFFCRGSNYDWFPHIHGTRIVNCNTFVTPGCERCVMQL